MLCEPFSCSVLPPRDPLTSYVHLRLPTVTHHANSACLLFPKSIRALSVSLLRVFPHSGRPGPPSPPKNFLFFFPPESDPLASSSQLLPCPTTLDPVDVFSPLLPFPLTLFSPFSCFLPAFPAVPALSPSTMPTSAEEAPGWFFPSPPSSLALGDLHPQDLTWMLLAPEFMPRVWPLYGTWLRQTPMVYSCTGCSDSVCPLHPLPAKLTPLPEFSLWEMAPKVDAFLVPLPSSKQPSQPWHPYQCTPPPRSLATAPIQ